MFGTIVRVRTPDTYVTDALLRFVPDVPYDQVLGLVQGALFSAQQDGWRIVRLDDTALLEADGRPVPDVTWAVRQEWTP